MPWLTALRTRWSTGSIIRSIRYLSISVVWPWRRSVTFLPVSRARSRTTNGMRRKISPTGTRRTRMRPSRSVRSWRSMATAFSCTARHSPAARAVRFVTSVSSSRARLITRSPTCRISSSRRARSTRTTCDGATLAGATFADPASARARPGRPPAGALRRRSTVTGSACERGLDVHAGIDVRP